jgi:hypothetical protein
LPESQAAASDDNFVDGGRCAASGAVLVRLYACLIEANPYQA